MIARIWRGRVPTSKADEYLHLMETVAIPDYQAISGNRGAYALRQVAGELTNFVMLTFWDSKEAIATFAGDDISRAKYYDFDRDFLLEFEPHVEHYEIYSK